MEWNQSSARFIKTQLSRLIVKLICLKQSLVIIKQNNCIVTWRTSKSAFFVVGFTNKRIFETDVLIIVEDFKARKSNILIFIKMHNMIMNMNIIGNWKSDVSVFSLTSSDRIIVI